MSNSWICAKFTPKLINEIQVNVRRDCADHITCHTLELIRDIKAKFTNMSPMTSNFFLFHKQCIGPPPEACGKMIEDPGPLSNV